MLDGRCDRFENRRRIPDGAAGNHWSRKLGFRPGRYNDYLHHPAIHGGELAASYTYGLCAPQSPEPSRRENWWYYSQSGPGVYQGDVYFYSLDWDARDDVGRINTNRCKVSLLTGEYDYSCTPAMTQAVADA